MPTLDEQEINLAISHCEATLGNAIESADDQTTINRLDTVMKKLYDKAHEKQAEFARRKR